jgi:hypothetical protein
VETPALRATSFTVIIILAFDNRLRNRLLPL